MRVILSAAVGALAMLSLADVQQRGGCELDLQTTPGTVTSYADTPDGPRIDVGGGVEATCGEKWVRADSASYYENLAILYLFRDVRYREGPRSLRADRATYYEAGDWVRAEGNVRFEDQADGSTLTGPVLEYYPASPRRPIERIFAPSRPHLTFYPDSGGGRAPSPFDVDADRMHIYGNSAMAAAGEVEALRGDLNTFSDSLDLDMGQGRLWLLGDPSVVSSDLTLLGDSILILLEDNRVSEILAWPNGSATGSELALEAPRLRFFVEDGEIVRAAAFGEMSEEDKAARLLQPGDTLAPAPGRPRPRDTQVEPPSRRPAVPPVADEAKDTLADATLDSVQRERDIGAAGIPISGPPARSVSEDFVLVADSIDIELPGGRVETLVAVGRARAASREAIIRADDTSLEGLGPGLRALLDRDWLEGDTITGHFEPSDSTAGEQAAATGRGRSELRRLVALGRPRALYHLREDEQVAGATNHPPVNYVMGQRQITLWLSGGQVDSVGVIGPATGTYLEPLPQRPDSVSVPPDTSGVPAAGDSVVAPDSSGVEPDSSGARLHSGGVKRQSSRARLGLCGALLVETGIRPGSGFPRTMPDVRRRSD